MGILLPALVERLFFALDWKFLKGQGLCLLVLVFGRGPSKGAMLNKNVMND